MRRPAQIIIALLLAAVPVGAAISRSNHCAAAATSCTLSGGNTVGDGYVAFCFRSGSTSNCTLPSGWTSVATFTTGSGSTAMSATVACAVATSTSQTSGTWTNGSQIEVIGYHGTNGGTTANCATTLIGAKASGSGTSATMSYTGITLTGTAGTSWVANFGASRTATNVSTPAGLTSLDSTSGGGGNDGDSNGTITGWSTATTSVNASTAWGTYVLEILAANSATTPVIVQSKYCPNSAADGSGAGGAQSNQGTYICPLGMASLTNNTIVVGAFWGSTQAATITDNLGDTYTQDKTNATAHSNTQGFYRLANAPSGIAYIKLTFNSTTANTGFVNLMVTELENITANTPVDVSSCNSATSATATAGSATINTANDYVIQDVWSDDSAAAASFTVGSQTGITWLFDLTDRHDGAARQTGVQANTGAFNASMTEGNSHAFASCSIAYRTTPAGTAPSGDRVLSVTDAQGLAGLANPYVLQVPLGGNLVVIPVLGGANSVSSISSSPSCTWSNTGAAHGSANSDNFSQILYAFNCTGNAVAITLTLTGTAGDFTFPVYDVTSATAWAFDADSGGQDANQTTQVASLTTCSGCLTPTTSSGVYFANFGQDFCTATAATAPSGSTFDSATYTGNGISGPQPVDQNNGWLHKFYSSSPGAITATWTEGCTQAQGFWGGRAASFKHTAGASACPATRAPMGVGC